MEMRAQPRSEAEMKVRKASLLLNDQSLVDWLSSYAHHLCRRSGLQEADADDLAQEAFQKAVVGIDTFRDDAKREPWLKSIVINSWRDLLRKKKRENARFLAGQELKIQQTPDVTDEQHVVDVRLVYRDLQQRIEVALHQLKARHRMALLLLIVEGLTYEQIAERMGIQQKQVRGFIFQARRKLTGMNFVS